MLHVGLDLSRRRVDVCVISSDWELVGHFPVPSDRDGLYGLTKVPLAVGGVDGRSAVAIILMGRARINSTCRLAVFAAALVRSSADFPATGASGCTRRSRVSAPRRTTRWPPNRQRSQRGCKRRLVVLC